MTSTSTTSVKAAAAITSVTLEVPDPDAAGAFYRAAFGLGTQVRFRASQAPTTGFRGFTLSLVVSQPSTVDTLVGAALDAGATTIKPVKKGFWGHGGVVRAPDGTIWKVATSAKKDTGPATRQIDDIVLLLGTEDVAASKQFYVEQGLTVARSFGSRYVEFDTRRRTSSWRSTGAVPWPRTPESPRRAPDRIGSPSPATPGPSPTRTVSPGKPPREPETAGVREGRHHD